MSPTPTRPDPRTSGRARTLWDEGRRPAAQVVLVSLLFAFAVARLDLALTGRLSLVFDLAFVVLCVSAALAIRPTDFFAVGVLPPILMFSTMTLFALTARSAVADAVDGLVQAVVSGLAHHAGALVAGYTLTLAVLALRQVALRNSGRLRRLA